MSSLGMASFSSNINKGAWIIEFYAPWCVHCQTLTTEWKRAAVLLEGEVQVGAVNCESPEAGNLCRQQGIRSFPTIMFFYREKSINSLEYTGEKKASSIYSWVMRQKKVKIVTLTASSFGNVVNSLALWVVDFSAPRRCGPCR